MRYKARFNVRKVVNPLDPAAPVRTHDMPDTECATLEEAMGVAQLMARKHAEDIVADEPPFRVINGYSFFTSLKTQVSYVAKEI